MGIIWDPSPDSQYHVHSSELSGAKPGTIEGPETGSTSVSPRGRRQANAISDRIEQRAMVLGILRG